MKTTASEIIRLGEQVLAEVAIERARQHWL